MMSFNLDCGAVLDGHRLLVTGLRKDGLSNDPVHADYSEHVDGKPVHPMVSLTYRIAPAVPEAGQGRDLYATVRLDPPADPAYWDAVLSPGAERRVPPGAHHTEAAVGPFILPDGTERITVDLVEATVSPRAGHDSSRTPDRNLGQVIVDVRARTARWQPATA